MKPRFFLIATVLVLGGSVVALWVSLPDAPDLEDATRRWRALGGQLEPTMPQIAESQNAAPIYAQVHSALLDAHPDAPALLRDFGTPGEPLAGLLDTTAHLIDRIDEAQGLDACSWGTGCVEQDEQGLEGLRQARGVARFLAAHATAAARRGDVAASASFVLRLFRLSDHIALTPGVLQLLTSLAVESVAYDLLESLWRAESLAPPNLARDRDYAGQLRAALLADGACDLAAFARPEFARRAPGWSPDHDKAVFLTAMSDAVVACEEPLHAQEVALPVLPGGAILSDMLLPAFPQHHKTVRLAQSRAVMYEVAVQLREVRLQTGSYPEFFPTPVDPLTGFPLVYELHDQGFTLRGGNASVQAVWSWH